MENPVKLDKSDDNEDILAEYLQEDPSVLSDKQLRDIAVTFNLPMRQVEAIAAGMTKAREEVRKEFGNHE